MTRVGHGIAVTRVGHGIAVTCVGHGIAVTRILLSRHPSKDTHPH